MSTTVEPRFNLADCEVTTMRVTNDHRLALRFRDGLVAELDFAARISSQSGPIVEPLRDPAFFAFVTLEDGVLTWPNGYDIDPLTLRHWALRGFVGDVPENLPASA